jgi:hypothetical protein
MQTVQYSSLLWRDIFRIYTRTYLYAVPYLLMKQIVLFYSRRSISVGIGLYRLLSQIEGNGEKEPYQGSLLISENPRAHFPIWMKDTG